MALVYNEHVFVVRNSNDISGVQINPFVLTVRKSKKITIKMYKVKSIMVVYYHNNFHWSYPFKFSSQIKTNKSPNQFRPGVFIESATKFNKSKRMCFIDTVQFHETVFICIDKSCKVFSAHPVADQLMITDTLFPLVNYYPRRNIYFNFKVNYFDYIVYIQDINVLVPDRLLRFHRVGPNLGLTCSPVCTCQYKFMSAFGFCLNCNPDTDKVYMSAEYIYKIEIIEVENKHLNNINHEVYLGRPTLEFSLEIIVNFYNKVAYCKRNQSYYDGKLELLFGHSITSFESIQVKFNN